MTRLSYRLYLWASALNYQLPRRLTKAGLLVATSMVLAGAIGSDIDQSVAFQAFALTFCLLTVAFLWAPFFRGHFVVRRCLPKFATVGQAFRYRVRIQNASDRAYRSLEVLENLSDPRPTLKEFADAIRPSRPWRTFRLDQGAGHRLDFRHALVQPGSAPPVGPRDTAEAELQLVPLRRGPLRFEAVTVARRDPLGLVRAFVRMPAPQSLLVLPKRYRVPPLAVTGGQHYQPGGVSMASSVGESEEFVSLRDYRPGDPFRRIHWRTWARAGRPIVKEFQDEYFARQALVLDTMADPTRRDVFEEAVSVAASFACTLETQDSLLDLLFVGSRAFCFTTGRGLGQSEQVLEILASVQPKEDEDWGALRSLVLRHAALVSACTCVFLQWDEPRRELVRSLRLQGLPVLVLVVGEGESREDSSGPVHYLRPGRVAEDLAGLEAVLA